MTGCCYCSVTCGLTHTHTHTHTHTLGVFSLCMCVCVCVCVRALSCQVRVACPLSGELRWASLVSGCCWRDVIRLDSVCDSWCVWFCGYGLALIVFTAVEQDVRLNYEVIINILLMVIWYQDKFSCRVSVVWPSIMFRWGGWSVCVCVCGLVQSSTDLWFNGLFHGETLTSTGLWTNFVSANNTFLRCSGHSASSCLNFPRSCQLS